MRSGFELFVSLASGCRVAWSGRVVFGFGVGLRIGCRVWVWSGSGVCFLWCGWVRALGSMVLWHDVGQRARCVGRHLPGRETSGVKRRAMRRPTFFGISEASGAETSGGVEFDDEVKEASPATALYRGCWGGVGSEI